MQMQRSVSPSEPATPDSPSPEASPPRHIDGKLPEYDFEEDFRGVEPPRRGGRRFYGAKFKLQVVRHALMLPENRRHKPAARCYPGVTALQVRKWIQNVDALEKAAAIENSSSWERDGNWSQSPHETPAPAPKASSKAPIDARVQRVDGCKSSSIRKPHLQKSPSHLQRGDAIPNVSPAIRPYEPVLTAPKANEAAMQMHTGMYNNVYQPYGGSQPVMFACSQPMMLAPCAMMPQTVCAPMHAPGQWMCQSAPPIGGFPQSHFQPVMQQSRYSHHLSSMARLGAAPSLALLPGFSSSSMHTPAVGSTHVMPTCINPQNALQEPAALLHVSASGCKASKCADRTVIHDVGPGCDAMHQGAALDLLNLCQS